MEIFPTPTCFERWLQWLVLWCCLLEVHVIDGAGVHGRGAFSRGLRPWSSVRNERPHRHSWWRIKPLTHARGEKRCVRLEGGAWWNWDPLLYLLGGRAGGGWDTWPSRSWWVREWPQRWRGILAAFQGAGRVHRNEVGAVGWWLRLGYGWRGHSHFGI